MATQASGSGTSGRNVPMSRPEEAIAIHKQNYDHCSTFVELDGGRILHHGGTFCVSGDGGVTWSQPYEGTGRESRTVAGSCLVRLNDGGIGLASCEQDQGGRHKRSAYFRRSEDEGRTWSEPVKMNDTWPAAFLQDTFLKTSSGRLLLPVYAGIRQGVGQRPVGGPFPGGYVNGRFIPCDAHFFDPGFTFSYVLYSDDDGRSWRQCEGELFIQLGFGGTWEYANEPSVAEISPGKLIMVVRTRLGRLFQAFSEDDGTTWTRLQPTALAAPTAPAQIRHIAANGHLLIVWTQENDQQIRKGLSRLRLSSAVSRNGGGVWEFFQNVESIWEETHVEPGPIRPTLPECIFNDPGTAAYERAQDCLASFPEGMGRWSYPSVLVARDRVLIAHTYSIYDHQGRRLCPGGNSRLKVLPLSWFYGGDDPLADHVRVSQYLEKLEQQAQP